MSLKAKACLLGAVLPLLVLAAPARAQDRPDRAADALLQRMIEAEGAAYVAARDELRALGAAARPQVVARLEAAAFSQKSWRADAVISIALAWLDAPEATAQAYALNGVRAAHYLKRRRPEPSVGAEIRHLGPSIVPGLLEVHLKTLEVYRFSAAADLGEKVSPVRVAVVRAAERAALREGILENLGRSRHPAAFPALRAVLLDGGEDETVRAVAAVALGEHGGPLAFANLDAALADEQNAPRIRIACLQGLARLRTEAALARIAPFLGEQEPQPMRAAAAASIGACASSWAWQTREDREQGDAFRTRASGLLVDALAAPGGAAIAEQLVTALAVVAHPSGLADLQERRRSRELSASDRDRLDLAILRLELALSRR